MAPLRPTTLGSVLVRVYQERGWENSAERGTRTGSADDSYPHVLLLLLSAPGAGPLLVMIPVDDGVRRWGTVNEGTYDALLFLYGHVIPTKPKRYANG